MRDFLWLFAALMVLSAPTFADMVSFDGVILDNDRNHCVAATDLVADGWTTRPIHGDTSTQWHRTSELITSDEFNVWELRSQDVRPVPNEPFEELRRSFSRQIDNATVTRTQFAFVQQLPSTTEGETLLWTGCVGVEVIEEHD